MINYYGIYYISHKSKNGLNGINIHNLKIFSHHNIVVKRCIHHAKDDYDSDVFINLIAYCTSQEESRELFNKIKQFNPKELFALRKHTLTKLKKENRHENVA